MITNLKFIATIIAVALMLGGVLQSSVQTSAATAPSVNIPAAEGAASTPVSAVRQITGMPAAQAGYEDSLRLLEVSVPPCGLDFHVGDLPGGPLKIVYYTIRNCSNSTVRRKLEIAGTTDGECHLIPAHKSISDSRIIAGWAAVRGLKSC
jgi:hypothetical protein